MRVSPKKTCNLFCHLLNYEKCVESLNKELRRFNIEKRVRLEDHWPYQHLKWKLGAGSNIFKLSWQGLFFPGEPSFIRKVKDVIKMWLEKFGFRH